MSKISNCYLFYGDDSATLRQTVQQWQARFAEKSDASFDMSEHHAPINVEAVIQSMQIQPLLSPKRLIIIYGASTEADETQTLIVDALKIIGEATVLLFVEENSAVLQSAIGRFLIEQGQVKHFPALDPIKLRARIEKKLREATVSIKSDALAALTQRLVGASVNVEGELQKLILLDQSVITLEKVDQLLPAELEFRAFALGDAVLSGDAKRAWQIMVTETENGTEPMKLISQLIANVRRLIAMRELQDQKLAPSTSEYFRAQKPYTITMAEKQAKRFSLVQLCQYYQQLALSDLRIKTGDDPLNVLASLVKIA